MPDGWLDWKHVQHVAPLISSVTIAHPRSEALSTKKGSLRVDIAPPEGLAVWSKHKLYRDSRQHSTPFSMSSNALPASMKAYVKDTDVSDVMHASSPPARQPLIPDTHGDCARAGHPEAGAERNSCQGGLCGPGAPFASRLPNDKLTSQNPADWNCRPDTIHTHRSGQRIC